MRNMGRLRGCRRGLRRVSMPPRQYGSFAGSLQPHGIRRNIPPFRDFQILIADRIQNHEAAFNVGKTDLQHGCNDGCDLALSQIAAFSVRALRNRGRCCATRTAFLTRRMRFLWVRGVRLCAELRRVGTEVLRNVPRPELPAQPSFYHVPKQRKFPHSLE